MSKKTLKRKPTFFKQVPTLSGPKQYEFVSLRRREAMEIAHTSLQTVVALVGDIADLLFRDKQDEDSKTRKAMLEGLTRGIASVDFETVWKLGRALLRDVTIDGETIIEDLDETDYYVDNIDEFYSALVVAIEGNYPSVFSKVREALEGFDLPNVKETLKSEPPKETSEN